MTNYPKGAEALLIAMQTPSPKGTLGIPVLLWGKPGVGKSSFLEGLHAEKFPVITLIASIHDPTDFSGLPVQHEGRVRYAIPEWVEQFGEDGNGLLFLDELTTAPPAVQAALLRVVLERKVGFHSLPNNVRIVAAANPPDMMSGGWELSPPLRNRFVHLQWDLPANIYIEALESGFAKVKLPQIDPTKHAALVGHWKLLVAAFLKRSPSLLYTSPENDPYAFATPRTWDFTASLLASCDLLGIAPKKGQKATTACLELVKGALGEGVTIPFLEFLNSLKLPDPVKVLDGEDKLNMQKLNDSEIYVLFGSLTKVLKERAASPALHQSVATYIDLVEQVIKANRRDIIFVSLKEAFQPDQEDGRGVIMNGLESAKKVSPEAYQQLMDKVTQLANRKGLMEFVEILMPKS